MINILAFSPHPDDIELYAGGCICLHSLKYKIGIIDLTCAEKSSNGNKYRRLRESQLSAYKMNLSFRKNLMFDDCRINSSSIYQQDKIIEEIRDHRPSLIMLPYYDSEHPDHKETAKLVEHCVFKASLENYVTNKSAHTCTRLIYYMMDTINTPNILIDITSQYKTKCELINIYQSQFVYNKNTLHLRTKLNSGNILYNIKCRDSYFGSILGVKYAEGFFMKFPIQTYDLFRIHPYGAL